MSEQDNLRIVRSGYEAFGRGDRQVGAMLLRPSLAPAR